MRGSLVGVHVGPWVEIEHCATRALLGTDPMLVKNRVAFIEKTGRVLLDGEWVNSDIKDSEYGKSIRNREWCDSFLREHGAILHDD